MSTAAVLPNRFTTLALVVVAIGHAYLRYPVRSRLLLVSHDRCFALPAEGRFRLRLADTTRLGVFWIRLVFTDRPSSHILLLRDQLPELEWRRLCLILRDGD